MKLRNRAVIFVFIAALSFSVGFARDRQQQGSQQPEQGRGHMRGQLPPPPLFIALDTDNDHKISAAELKSGPGALKKLDKNKDGQLTRDELQPKHDRQGNRDDSSMRRGGKGNQSRSGQIAGQGDQAGGIDPGRQQGGRQGQGQGQQGQGQNHGHHPPPPLVSALDANRDGKISAAEIANANHALKALDTNKDGCLTHDELRPKYNRQGNRK